MRALHLLTLPFFALAACSSPATGTPPGGGDDSGCNGAARCTGGHMGDSGHSSDGGLGPDGSHAGDAGGDVDGSKAPPHGDGGGSHSDGGSVADGSMSGSDGAGGADVAIPQGSCSAGQVRCGAGDIVEQCSSGGTSWLYLESCTAGCSGGLCNGTCTPGAARCSGMNEQTCSDGGTAYVNGTACTTYCSTTTGACASSPVAISTDTNMDGVIVVDGDFSVLPNATLSSPTGNLTIYASSITVQQGGSIAIAATGITPTGAGGTDSSYAGGGGGYGTNGTGGFGQGGAVWGSSTDSDVAPGSPGGGPSGAYAGGMGGGVLRLFASTISIAGTVTVNGANGAGGTGTTSCTDYGGGGGSGGGVLIAGNSVTVSGVVSATGGAGACTYEGTGGNGRIKVLAGGAPTVTGTLTGTVTQGLLPPIPITSTTHPNPALTYNDNFPSFDFSWNQAFPSVQGYYELASTSATVPTPGNASFLAPEFISIPSQNLFIGESDAGMGVLPTTGSSVLYFQVVPVGASSNVGTVETIYPIHINSTPPALSSSSHPTPTTFVANQNPYFSWTYPVPTSSLSAAYYVFDHYGDTVPTAASGTMIPISQTNQLLSNIADGIWVFHLVTTDTRGYFTKVAGSYRVSIGADPGSGNLSGLVSNGQGQPVVNATVTLNRGLYTTTTNSSGTYNFPSVPAEPWEVSATASGQAGPATTQTTVVASGQTVANVTF